jgi:flagellar biosynthesis chaperone FliJ
VTNQEREKLAKKLMIAKLDEEIGTWNKESSDAYQPYLCGDRPFESIVASCCKHLIHKLHTPPIIEIPIGFAEDIKNYQKEIEDCQLGIRVNPKNKQNYLEEIEEYNESIKSCEEYQKFIDKLGKAIGKRFLSFAQGEVIELSTGDYEVYDAKVKMLGQYWYCFVGDWIPVRRRVLTIAEAEAVNEFISSYSEYSPKSWQELKDAMQKNNKHPDRLSPNATRIKWGHIKAVLSQRLIEMLVSASHHKDVNRFEKIAAYTVGLITSGISPTVKAVYLLPPKNFPQKNYPENYKSPPILSTESAIAKLFKKDKPT